MAKLKSKSKTETKAVKESAAVLSSQLQDILPDIAQRFTNIERVVYRITHCRPAENTKEARIRATYASLASPQFYAIRKSDVEKVMMLAELGADVLFKINDQNVIEALEKLIPDLSDAEFMEIYPSMLETLKEYIEAYKETTPGTTDSVSAWAEYTTCAAVYPPEYALLYPVMGLLSEIEEYADESDTSDNKEYELGDILWQLGAICSEWGASEEDYDNISAIMTTPITPCSIVKMHGLSDVVGKLMRDHPEKIGDFSVISNNIMSIFSDVINCAGSLEKLREVAIHNMEKIYSRVERNVIHGSGNKR